MTHSSDFRRRGRYSAGRGRTKAMGERGMHYICELGALVPLAQYEAEPVEGVATPGSGSGSKNFRSRNIYAYEKAADWC